MAKKKVTVVNTTLVKISQVKFDSRNQEVSVWAGPYSPAVFKQDSKTRSMYDLLLCAVGAGRLVSLDLNTAVSPATILTASIHM